MPRSAIYMASVLTVLAGSEALAHNPYKGTREFWWGVQDWAIIVAIVMGLFVIGLMVRKYFCHRRKTKERGEDGRPPDRDG